MPTYVNSPITPAAMLQKGVNCYLFGKYNDLQANTRMLVSQVTVATNVATLTVQIVEGEIPVVGAYISVTQTATSSGVFNVARATITAVSINPQTGQGTVSYALTNGNIALTADAGTAIAEVPEIPETLAAVKSVAVCVAAPEGDSQFTATTSVIFPTVPTAVTVAFQEAVRNVDSEFTSIGNAAVITGGAYAANANGNSGATCQFTLTRGNFYRFLVSGITGTGTIVAKVV